MARPWRVVRIVIPEGTEEQIIAACADTVDRYLFRGGASVAVVFAYETPGEIGDAFTRCRAEGTSDGRGHAGNGEFTMFGTEDDGRIQVQVANGTTSSEVIYCASGLASSGGHGCDDGGATSTDASVVQHPV